MVTGGLGYCGRHVVQALANRGERVVSYNRDYAEDSAERLVLVQGELYDIPRLLGVMREHDVGRIVHTAAMSHPDLSIEFPIATFQANVEGTVHLLEAARLAEIRRVVSFSSETVYGHVDGPVLESAPLHPTTPYGVTKVAGELLADVYNRLYGMDTVCLRFSEVYGPCNKMPTALRDMLLAAIHNRPFRMAAGGDHRFQFIHVDDVAQATLCALDCLEPTVRVFNITGGSQVALRDAAHIIRNLVPGADIDIGPGFWHLDRQGEWDISAAERELGYRPRVTPTPESPGTPTGCGSIRINARVGRRHRSFTGVTLDQRVLVEYETAVGPVRLLEVTAKHGLANPLPFPHPPDRSRRAWQRRATDRGHAWRTRL